MSRIALVFHASYFLDFPDKSSNAISGSRHRTNGVGTRGSRGGSRAGIRPNRTSTRIATRTATNRERRRGVRSERARARTDAHANPYRRERMHTDAYGCAYGRRLRYLRARRVIPYARLRSRLVRPRGDSRENSVDWFRVGTLPGAPPTEPEYIRVRVPKYPSTRVPVYR